MSSSAVSNTNSKYCAYGCNTKIYWNTLNSEYSEVLTKKKHCCPNRAIYSNKLAGAGIIDNNISTKPTLYKNDFKNNYNSKNSYNYKYYYFPEYY